jgi:eukaryotic-like serine/threonine-protein kinase
MRRSFPEVMRVDPLAWTNIAPYLDQALDLEPGERCTWLKMLESTQAELAHTLRELLAERDALNERSFLTGSALLPQTRLDIIMPALEEVLDQHTGANAGPRIHDLQGLASSVAGSYEHEGISAGTVLGPYRLLHEIGHGGMSAVWLAERCDGQFNRQVALKLPFAGPRRAQMAERFKRERDILAALTHPNIARLYDAGVGSSGQPYLAMEYVRGTQLTVHCDSIRLPIRERLALFLQVLAAVEFAHTHLILHRDLKPSNIQVTAQGRVVLLDFGVAKLLTPDATADSPPTELATRMLTPDYASPEHLSAGALWTTSDVYSLGVVLYELLAGVRPFHAHTRRELEEAILTRDPPRPSQLALTEVTAEARHTTPRKLMQTLGGDLDTIVMKALKKSPAERYQSIDAFARDVDNYLRNLPVSARPDSAWYRMRRFAVRNKLQVAASVVTSLSIIVGASTAVWQARETGQQRDRALALASRNRAINDFTSMLIGEAASSEKPVTVKEMLSRSESLALAGVAGNNEDQAAILETIAKLHYNTSADVGKAAQLLERALTLVSTSSDSGMRARLTCFHAMMVADMGEIEAAAGAINRKLDSAQLDHENASHCLSNLAMIAQRAGGDPQDALRYATAALEHFYQADTNAPADEAELLGAVAYGHNLQGDNARANRYYELALQKYSEAGRERSPGATVVRHNWGLVSASAGVPKRALELYDQVLSIVMERDPDAPMPVALIFNRGRVLEGLGRYAQARDAYELGRQLAERSKNSNFQVSCLLSLAAVAERSGDRATAARYIEEGEALLGASLSAYRPLVARRAVVRGRLDLAEGKLDQARAQFDSVLARKRKNETAVDAALGKAHVELLAGDTLAAASNARIALEMSTFMQGEVAHSNFPYSNFPYSNFPYSNFSGLAWLMLGRALHADHALDQAHGAFEAAVTHLSKTVDADHPELVRARELLAATADVTRR